MFTGHPIGKRPLGRSARRCDENIKTDLKEIGVNMRNWIDLAQDKGYCRALVYATLNLRVPKLMGLLFKICKLMILASYYEFQH